MSWETETDEEEASEPNKQDLPRDGLAKGDNSDLSIIDGATWDSMPVPERVDRCNRIGMSGQYGSKSWDALTTEEKAILSGKTSDIQLQYGIKAHVALEDSDKAEWGIVRDTERSLNWKTGEGAIVGTWSRSPIDGLFHVFLEPSIEALHDKTVRLYENYVHARSTQESATKVRRTRTPKPKVTEPEEQSEAQKILDNLKNKFKK